MEKPTVRENVIWRSDQPTPVAPLPGSGGCVVVRTLHDPQGRPKFQVDLYVAAGQKASYTKSSTGGASVVDLPEGAMVPNETIGRAVLPNEGDPPPPHPPIGPGGLWMVFDFDE